MSGHNKWTQIKRQKEAVDKKRALIFAKLLKAISVAARSEPNPDFNPKLRAAIEKAKENNVPQDNIERAIKKASEANNNLEELIIESYGPEGTAFLIEAATDNKNRTISEIKKILADNEAKFAEAGSVQWAFENIDNNWKAKFPIEISQNSKEKIQKLLDLLEDRDDVLKIFHNIK
jgi:YebC/PmpR family DNA-binding regulatory protein